MTRLKEEVFTFSSPETGGLAFAMPCHAGPRGEAPAWSGGRRSKGKAWARAFIVVFVERNG